MKSLEIRQAFIDFFAAKGHHVVPAAPVVPQNDPTILFTNAGMNQFKDIFLGASEREYTRAVDSQPCIRVSGKHNDLEDVGADHTHLTLFEMLGNWSFGDYYKLEAIQWAWELLTDVYKLPADRLYATVYTTDDESETLWREKTSIRPDHILRFGNKENFWEMGETGPCGPCSELHLDLGPDACNKADIPHVCGVNGDCARYVELWNLVFIQYNRVDADTLEELPKKHVDTGAGLERIAAFLQGSRSAYATDLFAPLIQFVVDVSGVPYDVGPSGMPHRVLADHVRTLSFAIADNVRPSNEGRGYVLRRILRRASRYAKQLGINGPVIYQLVDPLVKILGGHYTHIAERQTYIEAMIRSEEESFLRTLESGISIFESMANSLKLNQVTTVSGEDAFKLYDTYGFPLDLTELMARENGLSVDVTGFETHLADRRAQSRSGVKLHYSAESEVPMGGEARIVTDPVEKLEMARHHTATHLIQAALRSVLGDHVVQAGSLVDTDRLRFDFSHFSALTDDELSAVQAWVDRVIGANLPVTISHHPIADAKAKGAMALFGEKYDEVVRVVTIGDASMELCGGTHVSFTGEIEIVKIISETGIAAGTRRIEAVAGNENYNHYLQQIRDRQEISRQSKLAIRNQLHAVVVTAGSTADRSFSPDDLEPVIIADIKALEKRLGEFKANRAVALSEALVSNIKPRTVGHSLVEIVDDADIATLKNLADSLCSRVSDCVVVVGSSVDGVGHWVVKTGANVSSKWTAPQLIEAVCSVSGGKGGGRPTMAQAGGADPSRMAAAADHVTALLK